MFRTIEDVKAANAAAGNSFFSPDTLRFFGSRIHPALYGGRYFVTSEFTGFDRTGRAYTVRAANSDGSIETVSEFLEFKSRNGAHAAAARLAGEEA